MEYDGVIVNIWNLNCLFTNTEVAPYLLYYLIVKVKVVRVRTHAIFSFLLSIGNFHYFISSCSVRFNSVIVSQMIVAAALTTLKVTVNLNTSIS